jgi:hypothetical protein
VAASTPEFHSLFHLPLSSEAYNQFLQLTSDVQGLQLSDLSDAWSYIWGSSFFSERELTHISLVTGMSIVLLSGYGDQLVRTTESSSGFF